MKWHEIVPVVISVAVIVLVAVLERQSKLVAALTAAMPLTMPLALWIVYNNNRGEKLAVEEFARGMAIGVVPTLAFAVAAWLGARAGMKIGPLLLLGYGVWAVGLVVMIGLRRVLGG